MDSRHTGDIFKHLEKQNELLMEAYRSMSHELHKLQIQEIGKFLLSQDSKQVGVEEEMLMRKFYEIMSAHGKIKKIEDGSNVSDDSRVGDSTALVISTNNEEQ